MFKTCTRALFTTLFCQSRMSRSVSLHACTHACRLFLGSAVWLMQKCKWLQALKKRRDSGSSTASSSRSRDDLSLTSPLSRVVCSEIGKGRPAHLLQKICSAAVEEAGAENVSGSNLAPFISDVWGPVHGCRSYLFFLR